MPRRGGVVAFERGNKGADQIHSAYVPLQPYLTVTFRPSMKQKLFLGLQRAMPTIASMMPIAFPAIIRVVSDIITLFDLSFRVNQLP